VSRLTTVSLGLGCYLHGVPFLPSITNSTLHVRLCHIAAVGTYDAPSFVMDLQHDLRGCHSVLVKHFLEDVDHEFLSGVVVVVEHHDEAPGYLHLVSFDK